MVEGMEVTRAPGFDEEERQAVYRAIRERRDVRRGFLPEPIPDDLLSRLLEAAHKQKELEVTKEQIVKTTKSVERAATDIARWRENLKAAGGDKGGAPATLRK